MLTLCIPSPTKRTKLKLENWDGSCSEGTRVGLELAGISWFWTGRGRPPQTLARTSTSRVLCFTVRFLKTGSSLNIVWLWALPRSYCWSNGVKVHCPDAQAEDRLQPGLLIEKPSVCAFADEGLLPPSSFLPYRNGEALRASQNTDPDEKVFVKSRPFINCRSILESDLTVATTLLTATLFPNLQYHLFQPIWKHISGTYLCWPGVLWVFL